MAERKVYIGSVGPYLFDDTDPIDDADGEFSGELQHCLVSNRQAFITEAPAESDELVRLQELNDSNLFRCHTLDSGEHITISNNKQKLTQNRMTVNGTGSITIDGSGELCVIGA